MPEQSEIKGNEKVDECARHRLSASNVGPVPSLGAIKSGNGPIRNIKNTGIYTLVITRKNIHKGAV